ncbi:hypothetical protein [Candidatus Methylacidithermus pantelleriae]|uniref:Uncharacterized protein n=1 Tax=Candidatus Methylacidithermus pantelleriae TaxID=2744239 RepID=A0A8J2FMX6_9BACT|nr:hypothetical protein [Candidatus Methylacidithermus pantelleriae]CAF0688851.1 hypothetical protein MPNT_10028 [Candidatus Methylacidithermus pantelleriae]
MAVFPQGTGLARFGTLALYPAFLELVPTPFLFLPDVSPGIGSFRSPVAGRPVNGKKNFSSQVLSNPLFYHRSRWENE